MPIPATSRMIEGLIIMQGACLASLEKSIKSNATTKWNMNDSTIDSLSTSLSMPAAAPNENAAFPWNQYSPLVIPNNNHEPDDHFHNNNNNIAEVLTGILRVRYTLRCWHPRIQLICGAMQLYFAWYINRYCKFIVPAHMIQIGILLTFATLFELREKVCFYCSNYELNFYMTLTPFAFLSWVMVTLDADYLIRNQCFWITLGTLITQMFFMYSTFLTMVFYVFYFYIVYEEYLFQSFQYYFCISFSICMFGVVLSGGPSLNPRSSNSEYDEIKYYSLQYQ